MGPGDGGPAVCEQHRPLAPRLADEVHRGLVTTGGTGDVTSSAMIWKKTQGLPYVPSGIFYRGAYILVKDGGIVTAYDANSGDERYRKRAVATGGYYASPVAANGNVYFTSLDDGTITVLDGKSEGAKVVAKKE